MAAIFRKGVQRKDLSQYGPRNKTRKTGSVTQSQVLPDW